MMKIKGGKSSTESVYVRLNLIFHTLKPRLESGQLINVSV